MENNQQIKFIARTFYGLESVLAKELQQLGARDVKELNRAVRFTGDIGFMYKANYKLRTAIDILQTVTIFHFYQEDDYYKKIYSIPWDEHFGLGKTFRIKVVAHNSSFRNTHYAELLTKDAVVDKFKDNYEGERPNVDAKNPDVQLFVHIEDNKASVYLNTSGQQLFKRGYRTERHEAPINEVLAAGMLKLAGWPKQQDFLDPMCGSGTLLIEAILAAQNIPSGVVRKEWSFMHLKSFDEKLWEKIKEVSINKIEYFSPKFYASDKSGKAVSQTLTHLKNIKLDDVVQLEKADFFEYQKSEKPKFIISNPPYDVRLEENLAEFYDEVGTMLKHAFTNSEAWFIAPKGEIKRNIGLKPMKRYRLFQGKIECEFNGYSLYKGSKRIKE